MQLVQRFSYGRGLLGKNGAPNRMFVTFLFVTRKCRFNSLRKWVSSRVRCSVTSANEIRRAPPTLIILTDIGGDVERVLLGSGIVGRFPLGTGIPPFLKFLHIVARKDCWRVQSTPSAKPPRDSLHVVRISTNRYRAAQY